MLKAIDKVECEHSHAYHFPPPPLCSDCDCDTRATLGSWCLTAEWAHPIWKQWFFTVIHLRPLPKVEAPHLEYFAASHEIMVRAMDPNQTVKDELDLDKGVFLLDPPDQIVQFTADNDEHALKIMKSCVTACCERKLSPDCDYHRMFKSYFSKWRPTDNELSSHPWRGSGRPGTA